MANTKGKLKVFLCHASENKPIVQELYDRLVRASYEPWLDTEVLLPGMDWDLEIKKGLRASDAVLVCLSKVSVAKEGYIQKELRLAQDIQDEKPQGTIFLIPVRLDNCKTPYNLQDIQWADYTAPNGFDKLVGGLNIRAKQLGKELGSVVPGGAPASAPKPTKKKARKKTGPQVSAGDGSIVIMGDVTGSNITNNGEARGKKNR
ncbi:MAG: toll/interleukin-1 receptor domain-containing protein [Chloroflexota bacterium]